MKILYFAWLRAKTGTASEEVSPPPEVNTVGALMEWLAASRPGFAEALSAGRTDIGAVASFVGLVREHAGEPITAMTLEHYPGMTEKKLAAIEAEAHARWPLQASLIVHRYGRMLPGEPIVLVATASAHRAAALEACAFLIDWLKTEAPFWKLEETVEASRWVEARSADDQAAARWQR